MITTSLVSADEIKSCNQEIGYIEYVVSNIMTSKIVVDEIYKILHERRFYTTTFIQMLFSTISKYIQDENHSEDTIKKVTVLRSVLSSEDRKALNKILKGVDLTSETKKSSASSNSRIIIVMTPEERRQKMEEVLDAVIAEKGKMSIKAYCDAHADTLGTAFYHTVMKNMPKYFKEKYEIYSWYIRNDRFAKARLRYTQEELDAIQKKYNLSDESSEAIPIPCKEVAQMISDGKSLLEIVEAYPGIVKDNAFAITYKEEDFAEDEELGYLLKRYLVQYKKAFKPLDLEAWLEKESTIKGIEVTLNMRQDAISYAREHNLPLSDKILNAILRRNLSDEQ